MSNTFRINSLPDGAVPHCRDIDMLSKPPRGIAEAYVWHFGRARHGHFYFDATTSEGHHLICDGYCKDGMWSEARAVLEALIAVRTGCWSEGPKYANQKHAHR